MLQNKELDRREAITRERSLGGAGAAECSFVRVCPLQCGSLDICYLGSRTWALMGKRVRVVCIP